MSAPVAARPRVVVVGLGPGGPELTTPAAADALREAPVVFLRTARHPAALPWLGAGGAVALDERYERAQSFEDLYRDIVALLAAAAAEHGSVAYAVPGSPSVAERSVELLRREQALDVVEVPGLSFCDLAWTRLGVDPVNSGVRLVDAESFALQAAGDAGPLLVAQCWSRAVLSTVKLSYDAEPGPAVLLHHLGLEDEVVVEVPWSEIDRTLEPDHLTSLYLPAASAPVAAELTRLAQIVRTLRERCPWDREQTHASLVKHLLEETYETMEAIESLGPSPESADLETAEHVEEELGDLLCQVMFHATLAEEEGLFNLADVARRVHDKLVARHPHVFGDVVADSAGAVLANWERNKQSEKNRAHLFEGIPAAMPALARAAKVERKLASYDLGWTTTGLDAAGLVAALAGLLRIAEWDEPLGGETGEAIGSLLLEQARLIAHRGGDAESLLRHAIDRLGARVVALEAAAGGPGSDLGTLAPERRVELWREAGPGA